MSERATLPESLVPAVPGLAVLAYGLTIPDEDVRLLFGAVLSVLCFSCFAVVLLSRGSIRRWSVRRAVRRVAALTAGAVVALFLFFSARASLVGGYRWPPESDSTVVTLMPARLRLLPPSLSFPYGDCRDAMGRTCTDPVPREARSADEVAALIGEWGPSDIRLPSRARHTSTAILLFLYTAAAVQLILLFGILAMRRITPKVILEEFRQT
ncbi:MAG TPA: hypothetical protein VFQ45_19830 [Longimicrobium sp.]|nr:hypothetical protein [Longimicrobium sp.]